MSLPVLASGGYEDVIRLWDVARQCCFRTLVFTESQANKITFAPNGKYLVVAGHVSIALFDMTSSLPDPITKFLAHQGNVMAIGFERRGDFYYTGGEDGSVKVWDPRRRACHFQFSHNQPCNAVELLPGRNELLAVYQDGLLCVLDIRTDRPREQLIVEPGCAIKSIALSPDGAHCCVGLDDGRCCQWKLNPSGPNMFSERQIWKAHEGYVLSMTYNRTGSYLCTTSADKMAYVWDPRNVSMIAPLKGHSRWVWDCLFLSDDQLVTASTDWGVWQWDILKGAVVAQFNGHQKGVLCLAQGLISQKYVQMHAAPSPAATA